MSTAPMKLATSLMVAKLVPKLVLSSFVVSEIFLVGSVASFTICCSPDLQMAKIMALWWHNEEQSGYLLAGSSLELSLNQYCGIILAVQQSLLSDVHCERKSMSKNITGTALDLKYPASLRGFLFEKATLNSPDYHFGAGCGA